MNKSISSLSVLILLMVMPFLSCTKLIDWKPISKNPPVTDHPQFSKLYGGSERERNSFITTNASGGYVLATTTVSNDGDVSGNHGPHDFWVVSVDRNGNKLWQKALGGSGSDIVQSIAKSNDGGYVMAGYTSSDDGDVTGGHRTYGPPFVSPEGIILDMWVVKVDRNGNKVWQKTLGGSGLEYAQSIIRSSDGGYLVAGQSSSNDGDVSGNHSTATDAWIVKLDEMGNIVWQKTYGGTGADVAFSIVATTGGRYLVGGGTASSNGDVSKNNGNVDAWLFQIDGNGNLLWQKTYGGTGSDYGRSVAVGADGDYILAGGTTSNDGDVSGHHGQTDAWVVKVDRNGNKLWQKALGGGGGDEALSIVGVPHVGYAFVGSSYSKDGDVAGNHGHGDAWIVTLDESGNLLGQKSLGGSSEDLASSLVITQGRNYVFGGYSSSNDGDVSANHGSIDAWIFSGKLDF